MSYDWKGADEKKAEEEASKQNHWNFHSSFHKHDIIMYFAICLGKCFTGFSLLVFVQILVGALFFGLQDR